MSELSDLEKLQDEVDEYLKEIDVYNEGERLYSNYQKVTAIILRLTNIHNTIANLEIMDQCPVHLKKFRTMVVDPTIERLEKVAQFESRKLTAKHMEWEMEKSNGL